MRFLKIILLMMAVWSFPANAESFCAGLKTVLADAKNSFSSLRGKFDFSLDEYEGTITLGRLSDCSTESQKGVGNYSCASSIPDNEAAAEAEMASIGGEIINCLGKRVKMARSPNKNKLAFKDIQTDDDIAVRYHRIVPRTRPPFYKITLSIDTVDLNR